MKIKTKFIDKLRKQNSARRTNVKRRNSGKKWQPQVLRNNHKREERIRGRNLVKNQTSQNGIQ